MKEKPHTTPWRLWRSMLIASAILIGFVVLGSVSGMALQQAGGQATAAFKLFTLQDANGKPVTGRHHPGELLLLYFGFTYCPDACPTTLSYLARVMKSLTPEEAARVQVAFVSIDPQRDTPERLREYLSVFDPRFISLSGTPEALAEAARSFSVIFRRTPPLAGPDTYGFDHTDLAYVVDAHGRQVVMLGSHLPEHEALRRLRQHLTPLGQSSLPSAAPSATTSASSSSPLTTTPETL